MRFIQFIRSIVWPAVLAVGFTIAAIIVAFSGQSAISETVALSAAAVTSALLATRA